MTIRLKAIFVLPIFSLISFQVFSIDGGCPHGSNRFVDLQGVDIEYNRVNDLQTAVKIQFNESYQGLPLYSVILYQGDWSFDKNGKEISSPDISATLNIQHQEHNGHPFVLVFLSNTNQKGAISIRYGERCGVVMSTNLVINSQSR